MLPFGRIIGIVLAVGGFILAVLAGLWIASQTSNSIELGNIIVTAMLAFVPVAFLIGLGLYLYTLAGREVYEESMVYRQRQLIDILKARGQVSFSDLAQSLGVSKDQIGEMVSQLLQLQIFSGYVNWSEESLSMTEPSQLQALTQCAVCNYRLPNDKQASWICPQCGAEYVLTQP